MNARKITAIQMAALLASVSSGAVAQSSSLPTPMVRSPVDQNGVNLASGSLQVSDAGISIGGSSSGLRHTRTWLGSGWTHGFMLSVTTTANGLSVVVGPDSSTFSVINGQYVSDQQDGSTLVDAGATLIYTTRDGTGITFDRSLVAGGESYYGPVVAVGREIAKPDGERVTLAYRNGGNSQIPSIRLQSATSNLGFELKYSYAVNAIDGATVDDWYRITRVMAINNAVDYCDPAADACTALSRAWPEVSYGLTASASGKIETVTGPAGGERTYTADTAGRIVSIKSEDPASAPMNVSYDPSGRVAAVQRGNYEWNYAWSLNGTSLTSSQSSPTGIGIVVTSNTVTGQIYSINDEFGKTTSMNYDNAGRLARATAPEGNYVDYYYDGRGNLTQTVSHTKPGTTVNNQTGLSNYAYFPNSCANPASCNLPTATSDAEGRTTDYTYDASTGQLLTETGPAVNGVRPQRRYTYTLMQASYKNASGVVVPSGTNVSRLTAISVCRTTSSCAGGPDEVTSTLIYGPQSYGGNNLLPVASTSGGNGQYSTGAVSYDAIGNALTTDGPLAGATDTTRYRYDSARRIIGTAYPDPDGPGGRPSAATRTTYDSAGRPIAIETGTVTDQSDAAWNAFIAVQKRKLAYNNIGLVQSDALVAPSGNDQYQLTEYAYDNLDRLLCATVRMNAPDASAPYTFACSQASGSNVLDRITRYAYRGLAQVISISDGNGSATPQTRSYSYTDNGKPLGDGISAYDGLDRVVGLNGEQLTLDRVGNVTQRQLRDGQVIAYSYDALNRLVAKDRPNTAYWETDQSYGYDLIGRLTSASDSNGHTLGFGYDGLGREVSKSDNWYSAGNASMQYDAAGRRTRLTWWDGFFVTYQYDTVGGLTEIRENGSSVLASFSYDALGRRTSLTRGNGVTTTYGYDAASRLGSLSLDLAGSAGDLTVGFTYNGAGQMATRTPSNSLYAWPGAVAVSRGYTTNALDQYTQSGNVALGYDGRGNLNASAGSTYAYTTDNQLAAGPSFAYAYDALGRLFNGNVDPGQNTTLNYDGDRLLAETDQNNGQVVRRYVYGPGTDEPLVWYEGAGTNDRRWLAADERGSVIAVMDSNGNAIDIKSYDEFGIPSDTTPANGGRFGYTGQAWLPVAGFNYYKARMYSPTLGRFLQPDPLGKIAGPNLYSYVGNDPLNFTDPSGLLQVISYCTGGYSVSYFDSQTGTSGAYVLAQSCSYSSYDDGAGLGRGSGGNNGGRRGRGASSTSREQQDPDPDTSTCSSALAGPVYKAGEILTEGGGYAAATGAVVTAAGAGNPLTDILGLGMIALGTDAVAIGTFAQIASGLYYLAHGNSQPLQNVAINKVLNLAGTPKAAGPALDKISQAAVNGARKGSKPICKP